MDCLDLGGGGDAPDLGYDAWYYQTCTEFVMPFCADGKQDMFLPSEFNFDEYKQNCINTFGTYPRKGTLHKIMETLKSGLIILRLCSICVTPERLARSLFQR